MSVPPPAAQAVESNVIPLNGSSEPMPSVKERCVKRGAYALEAIKDLELVGLDEERERGELAISLERTAHGRERGRVAQAQRGEALAERRDRDEARVGGGLGHAPEPITADDERPGSRVTALPAFRRNHP